MLRFLSLCSGVVRGGAALAGRCIRDRPVPKRPIPANTPTAMNSDPDAQRRQSGAQRHPSQRHQITNHQSPITNHPCPPAPALRVSEEDPHARPARTTRTTPRTFARTCAPSQRHQTPGGGRECCGLGPGGAGLHLAPAAARTVAGGGGESRAGVKSGSQEQETRSGCAAMAGLVASYPAQLRGG
jgi:hypothetical protein